MKTTTSERLKQLMSERNLKQVDILALTEPITREYGVRVSKSDLSQYVSGKTEPKQDKLTVLGKALNVSEAWLMGYDVPRSRTTVNDTGVPAGFEPLPQMSTVPLVGAIACGTPILAEQNIEARIGIPAAWRADFALTCKGDSMEPKIKDGDIVAIRTQPEVENGEVAAVRIGDEATLKRVFLFQDHLELRAENPAFSSIILMGEDMNTVHIEGKAVGFCRGI